MRFELVEKCFLIIKTKEKRKTSSLAQFSVCQAAGDVTGCQIVYAIGHCRHYCDHGTNYEKDHGNRFSCFPFIQISSETDLADSL